MKHPYILFICLMICMSAEAGNIKKDSLAFVNAGWEVIQLQGGATAMNAEIRMFDSQQSISILKYPAGRFSTRLLMNAIDVLLLIVSILLIGIVVLQKSDEDATKAFTGEKSELFSNKKESRQKSNSNQSMN